MERQDMPMNLKIPELRELKPRIMVCGVGGAGGNAVNNMIASGLSGVDFIVANTDAQALASSRAERIIQMGLQVTHGLGAGSRPEVGKAAAEEALEEIRDQLAGSHMVFLTAGMGGGTGTGAAPVIARAAREMGILTVGVVTKPFHFESGRRMRAAEGGIAEMQKAVDTLIIIPNQNLFRVANEKTTFADAFAMADQVLCSGVACITDLIVKEGLVNLDFADVCSVMSEMGTAMIGTGEATGERRAMRAAELAIANPLLDDTSMKGARGLLVSITGGSDLTLYEVDEAAGRIRQEVDDEANIIVGATFDPALGEAVRVSVVATGIDPAVNIDSEYMPAPSRAQPIFPSSFAPPAPVETAQSLPDPTEAGPPGATAPEVWTQPLLAPVIPFPEPNERRRAVLEESSSAPPAFRRRSLLERLGVSVSEKRASGWR
jgi:cell division protein FtsZ